MNWKRFLWLLALVVTMMLLVSPMLAKASNATPSYYVAIPEPAVAEATALGLNPRLAFDYGAYHWLELDAAGYDKLAASGLAYEYYAEAGTLQITQYRFDPLTDGEPALPAVLRNDSGAAGFRLVQMAGPTNDGWLSALEANGLKVLQYYPHYTFLVWGSAAQAEATESLPFVRWQGPVHPGYKMNKDLAGLSGRVQNVDVFFYNDGNLEATLQAIANLGAAVIQAYPAQPDKAFYDAIIQIDAARFVNLAQLNTVLWFGYSSPVPQLEDEMSSQIIAGNYSGAGVPFPGYNAHLANLGVDGSGVIWATIDTGVDYDHPDLGSHVVGGYDFPGACVVAGQPGSDCPAGGHGTHVTGIIGGDATGGFMDPSGFLYGLGVAPNYSIFAMNSLSAAAWPPAGGWQEHSKQAVLGNAVGGNNSWTTGEGTAHGYQASERTHDIMVLDGNFDTAAVAEPFIEVFSAGNSGPGALTLTSPKEGKNLVIVASSVNYRVGNINTVSSFSSRGPAVDGRYGITITTPGEQIASSRNDTGGSCSTAIGGTNNLYAYCSGTSMAAPHASGSIVLITEWWRSFNAGANPSSAMAKALLVNGAVDMGTADIPNTNEGWGRVNITNVISPSVPVLYYDQTDVFGSSGEQWSISFGVAEPSEPLKITLIWADAPGAVGANPALVNNLNLTVDNSGTIYRGNVFSGGWSTTGGSADNLNNVENVFIQNPAGSATITIDAVNISGDAILYNADPTDQSFALVCQNCALSPDFNLSANPSTLDVCAPNNALYTINVGSILGFSDPVSLSASGNPGATTANFGTNPVNPPGSSLLTIGNTGSAPAGNYIIAVDGVSGANTHNLNLGLNLFTAAPAAPTLLTPPNGATNQSATPTFTWNGVSQAGSYDIEIATDAGFANIVDAATVAGTSYTPAVALGPNTTYYWHVRANNACGAGTFSSTFSFSTSACLAPNLAIPDNNPSGATYDFSLADPGSITDLNVAINVTHTWVGDLAFSLEHVDTGTTVMFFDRPGVPASTFGCSGDDIDATLDDEAATLVEDECGAGVPSISGSFIPNNPLSAFDGEDLAGNWQLVAFDLAGGDTGTVNELCIEATTSGGPTPTNTPVPPTATNTPAPPTPTDTPVPPTPTNTSEPPTATATTEPPTATATVEPPPPTATATPPATGVELTSFGGGNGDYVAYLLWLIPAGALLAWLGRKHFVTLNK